MSQNRHDLTQIFWGFSGPAASWGSSQGPGFTWFHRDSSMMGCSWIRFGITQKIMIFETLTIMWCHVESWKKTKDTEITHMKYYYIYIYHISRYMRKSFTCCHILSHFSWWNPPKMCEFRRIPCFLGSVARGARRRIRPWSPWREVLWRYCVGRDFMVRKNQENCDFPSDFPCYFDAT